MCDSCAYDRQTRARYTYTTRVHRHTIVRNTYDVRTYCIRSRTGAGYRLRSINRRRAERNNTRISTVCVCILYVWGIRILYWLCAHEWDDEAVFPCRYRETGIFFGSSRSDSAKNALRIRAETTFDVSTRKKTFSSYHATGTRAIQSTFLQIQSRRDGSRGRRCKNVFFVFPSFGPCTIESLDPSWLDSSRLPWRSGERRRRGQTVSRRDPKKDIHERLTTGRWTRGIYAMSHLETSSPPVFFSVPYARSWRNVMRATHTWRGAPPTSKTNNNNNDNTHTTFVRNNVYGYPGPWTVIQPLTAAVLPRRFKTTERDGKKKNTGNKLLSCVLTRKCVNAFSARSEENSPFKVFLSRSTGIRYTN